MIKAKKGSTELISLVYLTMFFFLITIFLIYTKIVEYDYFIEKVVGELQIRMRMECQIYKYDTIEEVREAFEKAKEEYILDYTQVFSKKVPLKMLKSVIEKMEIDEVQLDGEKVKNGFHVFVIKTDENSEALKLVWFPYKPKKIGYVVFSQEGGE